MNKTIINCVTLGSTGNGPCLEIQFNDGTYMWISDIDGCGMPKEDSWAVGHYKSNHDNYDMWTSRKEYLWDGKLRQHNMDVKECRALIISEMIRWGCESFSDGCSVEDTWMLMMKEMKFNIEILTVIDIAHAKAVISNIIDS